MSKIALEGNASGTGTFTIAGPNTNTNYTITLPQETGTLVTTGVTTGLNGSAITTGTVAASVGGTGITSVGTSGNVLTSNGSAWVSQAAAAGGGDYIMNVYAGPATGTWTKPAGLKAVKVTVVGGGGPTAAAAPGPMTSHIVQGGGGGGGAAIEYLDAPALPGPQPYTVGGAAGTSSFGSPAFLSATGGSVGGQVTSGVLFSTAGGAGGSGSGGQLNITGGAGNGGYYYINSCVTIGASLSGNGGNSILGGGGLGVAGTYGGATPGNAGNAYGGGAGGGTKLGIGGSVVPQSVGAAGVIIVEEFY
jgi:hypothetical protein